MNKTNTRAWLEWYYCKGLPFPESLTLAHYKVNGGKVDLSGQTQNDPGGRAEAKRKSRKSRM